jgi:hypothetical protein
VSPPADIERVEHRPSTSLDSRGGICEKPAKDMYEGQRVTKTLNTGMITVINHNSRTSSLMTELTFAHEVGHNLGAEVSRWLVTGAVPPNETRRRSLTARRREVQRRWQQRTLHHVPTSDDRPRGEQQSILELQHGQDGARRHRHQESTCRQNQLSNR